MKPSTCPVFAEHDTSLSVWLEDPKDPKVAQIRNDIVSHLRSRGFRVRIDAHTLKHYRSIAKDHHEGRRGDLEFKLRLNGRTIELAFFQNVVCENKNGGQYDFERRKKMPYLLGKAYEAERRSIAKLILDRHGLELQVTPRLRGMAFIESRRAQLTSFQGANFYARESPSYNVQSHGGRVLRDGDPVYFLQSHRLHSGVAFRNINSMWWVLLPCGSVWNAACHEIWHRDEMPNDAKILRGRKFTEPEIDKRMRCALAKAIEQERYERAVIIRDAFRKRFPVVERAAA